MSHSPFAARYAGLLGRMDARMNLLELAHRVPGVALGGLEFLVTEHFVDVAQVGADVEHQRRRRGVCPILCVSDVIGFAAS
jgi:hypothetical protein